MTAYGYAPTLAIVVTIAPVPASSTSTEPFASVTYSREPFGATATEAGCTDEVLNSVTAFDAVRTLATFPAPNGAM